MVEVERGFEEMEKILKRDIWSDDWSGKAVFCWDGLMINEEMAWWYKD